VDEPDGDGVEEMQLLPPPSAGDHEAGLLELLEVLHHAEARHREALLEGAEGLAVVAVELVEQLPPGGVGERSEDLVHGDDDT
jgi:hypothetical protein